MPPLPKLCDALSMRFQPEKIYLFGSKARGDEGPDSDYDLMVVVPDDAAPERRRSRLAYERLWGTGTAADVIVWTRSFFESRANIVASLSATILREGKLIFVTRHNLDGLSI